MHSFFLHIIVEPIYYIGIIFDTNCGFHVEEIVMAYTAVTFKAIANSLLTGRLTLDFFGTHSAFSRFIMVNIFIIYGYDNSKNSPELQLNKAPRNCHTIAFVFNCEQT